MLKDFFNGLKLHVSYDWVFNFYVASASWIWFSCSLRHFRNWKGIIRSCLFIINSLKIYAYGKLFEQIEIESNLSIFLTICFHKILVIFKYHSNTSFCYFISCCWDFFVGSGIGLFAFETFFYVGFYGQLFFQKHTKKYPLTILKRYI